jgi:hypothetical protein
MADIAINVYCIHEHCFYPLAKLILSLGVFGRALVTFSNLVQ